MISTDMRTPTAQAPTGADEAGGAYASPQGRCRWLRTAVMLLAVCAAAHPILAQTGQGVITGAVTDATGARIPGAAIEVKNNETKVVIKSVSDKAGLYNIEPLLPGTYTITVAKQGFEKAVVNTVTVDVAQTTTTNIKLQVGQESASVTITAQGNDLSKNTSDVETTVEHHLVEDLPYPERSALEAVLLVPGVTGDPLQPGGIMSENPSAYTGAVSPGGSLRVGGSIPGTTPIYVDGSNVTQASYPRAGINLSGTLVQETTVITSGLSAKYGRTGGGVIIQASAPGTNEYHGGLDYRHTDPFFQAYPDGNTQPADLHQNFFAAYFGGPVWIPKLYNGHGKTFFFVGVEPARFKNTVGTPGYVLTPAVLAGHFAGSVALMPPGATTSTHLYYQEPLNAQGFPQGLKCTTALPCPGGNSTQPFVQVPNDDLSAQLAQNPLAQFVASVMPTPSNPGPYVKFLNPSDPTATPNASGYNANLLRGVVNTDNRYSIRVDRQISNSDRAFARFTSIPVTAPRFYGTPASIPTTQVQTDKALSQDAVISYTHVFGNSIVNEAHFTYIRDNDTRLPPDSALTQDFAAKYGLTPSGAGVGFPSLGNLNPSGFSGLQVGEATNNIQVDENFQFGDDLTWTHGKHLFQMGTDLRRIQSNDSYRNYYYGGGYSFSASTTNSGSTGGDPFASFILGLVNTYNGAPLLVTSYYRWHYYSGYFQDDWRILPTVTLNLGMRWEYETPRMEKFDNQAFIDPTLTGMANGLAATGAFCFSGACNGSPTLWPANHKGFEPRVGIAWSPTQKTTVRAAYSYVRLPLTGYEATPNPNFTSSAAVSSTSGGVTPNQEVNYITNPIEPLTSTFPQAKALGEGFTGTSISGFTIPYVNQSSVVPYIQQWAFTTQYEPLPRTLIQVGYMGVLGLHLITPNTGSNTPDRNTPSLATVTQAIQNHVNLAANLPTCSATVTTSGCGNPYGVSTTNAITGVTTVTTESALQALNPFQGFFNVKMYEDYPRNGMLSYNALNISVRQSYGFGLSLLAYYTWSNTMDNFPDVGNGSSGGSGSTNTQNPFNLQATERAIAEYDQPSIFKAGYTYRLPVGKGATLNVNNRLLDEAVGGWSTSGIMTVASGFPNYVTLGGSGYFQSTPLPTTVGGTPSAPTSALPNGYTLRPSFVPGVPLINPAWRKNPVGLNPEPYLNPAAFTIPGSVDNPQLGNVPRTIANARSPREFLFDMVVRKEFRMKENSRYRLQISGNFINAFNHPVFFGTGSHALLSAFTPTGPTPVTTHVPAFGTLNASQTASLSRIIQVGGKFTF